MSQAIGGIMKFIKEKFLTFRNNFNSIDERFTDIWERFSQVWERITRLERTVFNQSGLGNITGRIDIRMARLEILLYYANPSHMALLDAEQKRFIQKLWSEYNYEIHKNTLFPEDPYYALNNPPLPRMTQEGDLPQHLEVPPVQQEGDTCYILLNGHKLYLPFNKEWAKEYIQNAYLTFESEDSPHTYLRPQDDGVDIPHGAILADIGAAEGFFGIKYLERCKKIYFFEGDPCWLEVLRKTCAPYGDKIEIVEGFVGDQPGNIELDKFFAQKKEKPNFIKMDIEGAEGNALRSMSGLLSDSSPLTMLICTYHRQEDWNNYYAMLHDRFKITSSNGYYWHIANMRPPFLRKAVMRAVKK